MDNKTHLLELYEAFSKHDMTTVLSGLNEDVKFISNGPSEIPWSGVHKGHSGALDFFRALGESIEIDIYERNMLVAEEDSVYVRGRTAGNVKSTGRRIDTQWIHAFTFADGKVVEFQEFYDTAGAVAALRGEK